MFVVVFLVLLSSLASAQWLPIGPYGGDVRALEQDLKDPDRLFLGTSAGRVYVSQDRGATWSRFAQFGEQLVIDNLAIDPRDPNTIYAAAWSLEGDGGELFRTRDGGRTWRPAEQLHGESIRALALSSSDPRVVIAGTLNGVFRSDDGGDSWARISPEGHAEIRNIESVAIHPRDLQIIYVGTWHLPWKTTDGGKTWVSIRRGIEDDSDVFSIILDRTNPDVIYLSACSGIYKSEDAGARFHKIQGIPKSAQRTRVIYQDAVDPSVVYAGTTEGLWKSKDAGRSWARVTSEKLIVNDVVVDSRDPHRVLLATDRSGVLVSTDSAQTFATSNRGFAHRYVSTLLVDRQDANTYYAGVLHDKEFGGVFVSHDAGRNWTQMSEGLNGADVFILAQHNDDSLLAGTGRGIFRFANGTWEPLNSWLRMRPSLPATSDGHVAKSFMAERTELSASVRKLDLTSSTWIAATAAGLLFSDNQGRSWRGGPIAGFSDFTSVQALGTTIVAAMHRELLISSDAGMTWRMPLLPSFTNFIRDIALDRGGKLWLTSDIGVFLSQDLGRSWTELYLDGRRTQWATYDRTSDLLWAATPSGQAFVSRDGGGTWERVATLASSVGTLIPAGERLLATTRSSGVVAGPSAPPAVVQRYASRGGLRE